MSDLRKPRKLNAVLAVTEYAAKTYRNLVNDYKGFFKNNQGAFRGQKNTYVPRDPYADEPGKRGNQLVQTTVDEKLQYFLETSAPYINSLFSQERTNSLGSPAKAELIVEGKNWGEYTAMELLRIKSLVEHGDLGAMYELLPVRSDAEEWRKTSNDMYEGRNVFEGPLIASTNRTTVKDSYILEDPNVKNLKDGGAGYKPTVATKDTVVEIGDQTHQKFSGEWSQTQRANLLRRRDLLITAVVDALKRANECDAVPSGLTAEKIFDYLHYGKNE